MRTGSTGFSRMLLSDDTLRKTMNLSFETIEKEWFECLMAVWKDYVPEAASNCDCWCQCVILDFLNMVIEYTKDAEREAGSLFQMQSLQYSARTILENKSAKLLNGVCNVGGFSAMLSTANNCFKCHGIPGNN